MNSLSDNSFAGLRREGWNRSIYPCVSQVLSWYTPAFQPGTAISGAPDEGFLAFPKSPTTIAPNFLNSLCCAWPASPASAATEHKDA